MNKLTHIEPLWTAENQVHFATRTDKKYTAVLTSDFADRGIDTNVTQLAGLLPDGAYIVGGAAVAVVIGGEDKSSDIDIAFCSGESFLKMFHLLYDARDSKEKSPLAGYKLSKETEDFLFNDNDANDAESVDELDTTTKTKKLRFVQFTHEKKPKIQLLKILWYEDAAHIIDTFDFTCVQFAIGKLETVFNPLGLVDAMRKRIVLHRMQFPASTIRRLLKYASKGYYCCVGSMVTISRAIKDHEFDVDILPEEQWVYVD